MAVRVGGAGDRGSHDRSLGGLVYPILDAV